MYQHPPHNNKPSFQVISYLSQNSFDIHSPEVFCSCVLGDLLLWKRGGLDTHPVLIPYGRPAEGRGGCVELRSDRLARGSADIAGGPATAHPGRATDTRRSLVTENAFRHGELQDFFCASRRFPQKLIFKGSRDWE